MSCFSKVQSLINWRLEKEKKTFTCDIALILFYHQYRYLYRECHQIVFIHVCDPSIAVSLKLAWNQLPLLIHAFYTQDSYQRCAVVIIASFPVSPSTSPSPPPFLLIPGLLVFVTPNLSCKKTSSRSSRLRLAVSG